MTEPMTHERLAGLAAEYASAVLGRQHLTTALRKRLAEVAERHAPALREAITAEKDCRAALVEAVTGAPELFEKPRTRTLSGIRYGWQQGKPRLDIPDEAGTIKKIEERLPPEQSELLLARTVRIHKPACLDLSAPDLRRLGIRYIAGEDAVVCKVMKDSVDLLVQAILDDGDRKAQEGL